MNRGDGTFAIILAPTRELCLQINDVLSTLLKRYHWLASHLPSKPPLSLDPLSPHRQHFCERWHACCVHQDKEMLTHSLSTALMFSGWEKVDVRC